MRSGIETPPLIYDDNFAERLNIAWRIEPGKKDPNNPLIEPKYPWDSATVFSHGTVVRDPIDGQWKAWYISTPHDPEYVPTSRAMTSDRQLTYAVSDDGVTWERPMLDLCPYGDYSKTNIILDMASGGTCAYASVFINPEEETDRRYEMFIFRSPGSRCPSGRVAGLPLPAGQTKHPNGLYRYLSGDGIHWRPIEGPVKLETEDSFFAYRDLVEPYTAYHKVEIPCFPGAFVPYDIADGTVRMIARRTSSDGSHWSDPYELMVSPDWRDPQDTQFMELTPIRQGQGLVAILTVYHNLPQTVDLQFAASVDGKKWWRPARRPCVELEPLGDYGGGMIWPMRQMVEEDEKLHLYYGACLGLHGDLYRRTPVCLPFNSAICRATWEKGRLWAAVPAAGGKVESKLTTVPSSGCSGRRLFINAATAEDGELSVELLNGDMKPVSGFSRSDCISFKGDDKCTVVRWKKTDICPVETASVSFYLRGAKLYGFDWR